MIDASLTDISYIKNLCSRYGFALSKGFGQNFIVNSGICPKIVEQAGVTKGYGVLEIGPGIGVLTKELARTAQKVVAVEIDKRLPALLAETLAGLDNVKIVLGDALKLDLRALIKNEFGDLPVLVCANLPYYITSPIIMKLLEERLPIESITVMVQKEAAERLCAKEASREGGAISLAVRYYAAAQKLFDVQAGSFYPPPKVTSSVIRLQLHKTPPVQANSEEALFAVIRAAFLQRRKTAQNSISAGLGRPKQEIAAALVKTGVSETIRPEQMTLQQFCTLSNLLFS